MPTALIRDLEHGLLSDFSNIKFPSKVYGFCPDRPDLVVQGPGTLYGFVWRGETSIIADGRDQTVAPGEYFSLPFSQGVTISGAGSGYAVLRLGYTGLRVIGGPVEERGRLKYIDGCSDTLLIAPPLRGDPCFNLLRFPTGIEQTKHTHPSIRVGLIHQGSGICHTAEGSEELSVGKMFILQPDAIHAFSTMGTDGMNLTVFHPDSDFGPTDDEHPMLNRTIVDGISARYLDDIRTKDIR